MKPGYVYILANKRNGTLYTGVTSNLPNRICNHKTGTASKFTTRYNIDKLVYVERFDHITTAILREKQIKKGNRKRKIMLIESMNSEWKDLSDTIEV